MAPITHIVMFKFKASASKDAVLDVCQRMHGLPSNCKHPETNKPYAKAIGGGQDTSPEKKNGGFTHAFAMQFDNDADRQHYLHKDPVHVAFVQSLADSCVEDVQVIDFVDAEF